jgi:5-methylthioadenosine/S-adenosylhomocysteine deaminase
MGGTKMIVAVGSQDRNYDNRILDIPHTTAVDRLNKYKQDFSECERTWIIPGPDQLFSNGPKLLKALKKWSKDNKTLIHIHSSEEPNTTKWFTQEYGMTPIEYADSIGFLDENTILAHQVNNTENDLKIIKRTGAKVVHNPLANTILGSGMPPVPEMMEMGIPVAISTDGSGSADFQNIICAARLASEYQKAFKKDAHILPAFKVLEMITAIPAEFLGLNTGQIAPGRDADLVILDLDRPNLTPSYLENIVENIIWAADGSEARWVVANGVVIKDNYRITTLDQSSVLKEVSELALMFSKYKKSAQAIKGTGVHK